MRSHPDINTRTHHTHEVHTRAHAHTRTRTHAHTRTRAHAHAHTRTRAHAHTRTRTRAHAHTRTHVHTHARLCLRARFSVVYFAQWIRANSALCRQVVGPTGHLVPQRVEKRQYSRGRRCVPIRKNLQGRVNAAKCPSGVTK